MLEDVFVGRGVVYAGQERVIVTRLGGDAAAEGVILCAGRAVDCGVEVRFRGFHLKALEFGDDIGSRRSSRNFFRTSRAREIRD